jgi:hypothetical protein
MCNYFRQSEVRRFDVEVTLYDLQVGRDGTQEFVCVAVGYVA